MKRISEYVVLFATLVGLLIAGCDSGNGVSLSNEDNNQISSGNNDADIVYTVTFWSNPPSGHSWQIQSVQQTYDSGSIMQFPGDLFSSAGYRIAGWSDNASSETPLYRVGDTFEVWDNRSFYAVWEDSTINGLIIEDNVVTGFKQDSGITDLVIPDGVTGIEWFVFDKCYSLMSVTIPSSMTRIETRAFQSCINLKTVYYGGTLAQWCAIDNDFHLLENAESVILFDGTDLKKMTDLVIPNGVTSIGDSAFGNCNSIKNVTIPSSVTNIEEYAFYNSVETVYYDGTLAQWCAIDNDSFLAKSESVMLSDGTDVKKLTDLVIPDDVERIGKAAFYNCRNLTSVTISNGVTIIGDLAFCGCYDLTSVTIPDSVTSIGNCAFSYCSFETVIIPSSVKSIGREAFYYCQCLETVVIPYGVTSIEDCTFDGCCNLTSVRIPSSVTSIGSWAFRGCDKLESVHFNITWQQWYKMKVDPVGTGLLEKKIIGNGESWWAR